MVITCQMKLMTSMNPEGTQPLLPGKVEQPQPAFQLSSRNPAPLSDHRLPLALWTALCALFFATLLLGVERLPSGDFSGQFHAFAIFQAQEMAAGRLPLWSPGSYGGFPFAADTQAAVFYPLRWLTVFVSVPWGFSYYLLEIEAIGHIWLAGLFTYSLAFAITGERWPALLAALAFALGGYLTSYPTQQLAILETITWLPLVLLFLRVAVLGARPVPWLAAAGLILGITALAGHPQTFLHVAYTAAAYYVYLSLTHGWTWTRVLGGGVMVGAVALGMAAAAWLPAFRLLRMTGRSAVDYHFVAGGLPMLDFVQILMPGALSLWSVQYVGLAAVALGLIALGAPGLGRRSEIAFWAMTALVAAWLALGDAGILFRLVYSLPGFGFFRQQERLLGIFSLSLALLAAQGLTIWLRAMPALSRSLVHRAAIALGLGLLVAAAILFMVQPNAAQTWLPTWRQQAALALVVLGLLRVRRWPQQQMVALILVLAFELYATSLGAMNRRLGSPDAYWPQPSWMEGLRSEEPARLDSHYLFHANVGEIYGLEDVHGISPLKLQLAADFEQLPALRRWQLLNVTHLLVNDALPGLPVTLLAEFDQGLDPDQPEKSGFLYRYDDALPRAWMSYRPIVVADPAAAWTVVAGPDFDPAREVVLHTPEAVLLPAQPPDTPPLVRIKRESAAGLAIQIETAAPGYLVISEWAYPGWQATVNGRKAPLLKANYGLQAIWLPAGEHEVTLRFRSPDVSLGVIISLLSLVMGLALASGRLTTARFSAGKGWRFAARQLSLLAGFGTPLGAAAKRRRRILNLTPLEVRLLLPSLLWLRRQLFPLLVGLFWLAFALRLVTLATQELRGDEGFSYQFAILPAAEIIPALAIEGDPHSPLHYLILHAWMQLAGDSEFAMRFISVVPSLLALPLMFQLGRHLAGRESGLLLALLLAVSQSQVWIGQDLRNHYTLVVFFTLLATLILLRALERNGGRWWAVYAAVAALAVYSHYYGIFALLAHGVYVVVVSGTTRPLQQQGRLRQWRLLRNWLAAGLAAAAIFAPWLLLTASQLTRQHLYDPSAPELARYLTAVGLELTVGSAFVHWLGPWIFLITLLLVGAGARTLLRDRPAWGAMLVTWLSLALLVIFLVRFRRWIFNDYYLTVAAPAWWLLAYTGLRQLGRRHGRWGQSAATLILATWLVANGAGLARYYTDPVYNRTIGYGALAAHVASERGDNDILIINFPDPALQYYLRDIPIAQTMQPAMSNVSQSETEAALAEIAAGYDRLWFVPANSNWDPENIAFRWLDYHNLKEHEVDYGKLSLLLYRPLPTVDHILFPVDATLLGLLRLEGLFVAVNGVPVELSETVQMPSGAKVNVTLVWQALARITESYTVFVHLLDDDGRLVAQHDGISLFGTRPTTSWQPGERFIDRHAMTIPAEFAAAGGNLWVGMYQTDTLARQPFSGHGDAIKVMTVTFEPAQTLNPGP
jgi:4-amino-4-deoxy-L-arabinose transferase-like glycosyltransferase